MATQHDTARDRRDDAGNEILTSSATAPVSASAHPGRGRRWLAVLATAGLLVVVVTAGYVGHRHVGRSVTVTDRAGSTAAQPGSIRPEAAAGLHVTLSGPGTVRAGRAATWTVAWADDDGSFVGSTQDWGDAGDGSAKQGRCSSTARVPGSGSLTATHTWPAAGTYRVRITVTTQACSTGAPTTQDASATATVVVTAP